MVDSHRPDSIFLDGREKVVLQLKSALDAVGGDSKQQEEDQSELAKVCAASNSTKIFS